MELDQSKHRADDRKQLQKQTSYLGSCQEYRHLITSTLISCILLAILIRKMLRLVFCWLFRKPYQVDLYIYRVFLVKLIEVGNVEP